MATAKKRRPAKKRTTTSPKKGTKQKSAAPAVRPTKGAPRKAPPKSSVTKRRSSPKVQPPLLVVPWPAKGPRLDAGRFLRLLPPMKDVVKPTKASLAKLGHRLPSNFAAFLGAVGFGRFGDGFLTLVHPHDLDETLSDWLGGFDPSRVPFARTALGDLLYFRDLRSRAAMLGADDAETACDISIILARYKKSIVIADNLPRFVDQILSQPKALKAVLRKDLFDGAYPRLGPPEPGELYGFVPALALGGTEDPAALEKMRAAEHLSVLLQL